MFLRMLAKVEFKTRTQNILMTQNCSILDVAYSNDWQSCFSTHKEIRKKQTVEKKTSKINDYR
jgi:hypothetical protein